MLDISRPYKWDGPYGLYLLYKEEWSKFLRSLSRKQRATVSLTMKLLGIESEFNTNWRAWMDPTTDSAPGNEYNSCGLKMMEWIKNHIGESTKKFCIKEAYSDYERGRVAIRKLEAIDTHSEYDRDDRVTSAYLAELLGISEKEVGRLYKKYGDTSRCRAVYDDTCGFGGGHHTYVGWSTKVFSAVSFIKKILHMYDVQEVK